MNLIYYFRIDLYSSLGPKIPDLIILKGGQFQLVLEKNIIISLSIFLRYFWIYLRRNWEFYSITKHLVAIILIENPEHFINPALTILLLSRALRFQFLIRRIWNEWSGVLSFNLFFTWGIIKLGVIFAFFRWLVLL